MFRDSVAQHVVLADGFVLIAFRQLGRRPQRQHVGIQRSRRVVENIAVVESEVLRMRDDRGADMHVRAEPADVVEMLMRIHQEANRLVRDELHDLLDHRQVPSLIERRFDHGNVILELDGHAVVRRAAEQIHAVRQLLCLYANGKCRPAGLIPEQSADRGMRSP